MLSSRFVLIGICLTACATRPSAPRQPTIRVDESPLLDIPATGVQGIVQIGAAMAGMRLNDGTIVIADSEHRALRVFDSRGTLVRTIGRRGTGPGEFRSVSWLGRCGGDTLFVFDRMRRMMIVYRPSGELAREFAPRVNMIRMSCSPEGIIAGLVPSRGPERRPIDDPTSYRSPIIIANARGDSIAATPDVKLVENRMLGRLTSLVVYGSDVYVGTADSSAVDVYGETGTRSRTVQLGGVRRAPTAQDYAAAIERLVAFFPDSALRSRERMKLQATPMPQFVPAYHQLLVSPSGTLWAVTSLETDSVSTLRGAARDGRQLGEMRFAFPLRVFEIGDDYVLGSRSDANGEQHIVVYAYRVDDPN